jgi:hypothetical protein
VYCLVGTTSFSEGDIDVEVASPFKVLVKTEQDHIPQTTGGLRCLFDLDDHYIGLLVRRARWQFEREKGRVYGPYLNEVAFNDGIVDLIKAMSQNVFIEMVADMVRAMPEHEIVLTHSDIALRNIIVRDGR